MPVALHLKWDSSEVCSTPSPQGPASTEAGCPWQQPTQYYVLSWLLSLPYLISRHLCQCFWGSPQTLKVCF